VSRGRALYDPAPGTFPFLRTFKPMLKRAKGTPCEQDVRKLLELWLHAKRLRRLLDHQNETLLHVSQERDWLLAELKAEHPERFKATRMSRSR
jgi:hypothetical protein